MYLLKQALAQSLKYHWQLLGYPLFHWDWGNSDNLV